MATIDIFDTGYFYADGGAMFLEIYQEHYY